MIDSGKTEDQPAAVPESVEELRLSPEQSRQVAVLYGDIENTYDLVAAKLDFSCRGCSDNCCDSYFQHHTYTEWAYLWEGLRQLDDGRRRAILGRAAAYVREADRMMARGQRPDIMCPLNDEGRCSLYRHRLLICRLHGVPASIARPDGKQLHFPGCFRCQERAGQAEAGGQVMDRTGFFKRMVTIEVGLLGAGSRPAPKIKLTLAQMLVQGPPRLTRPPKQGVWKCPPGKTSD